LGEEEFLQVALTAKWGRKAGISQTTFRSELQEIKESNQAAVWSQRRTVTPIVRHRLEELSGSDRGFFLLA
jgi:hypothetical protein